MHKRGLAAGLGLAWALSACTCAGAALEGMRFHCASDGDCVAGQSCVAGVCAVPVTPQGDGGCAAQEICGNGKDDDCNGLVDEGCPCTETDPPKPCYPLGLDSPTLKHPYDPATGVGCSAGAQRCVNLDASHKGTWSQCLDAHVPRDERCDGLDEDCDGSPDPVGCACQQGKPCYGGPPNTIGANPAGKSICLAGVWDCARPAGQQCVGEVRPLDHEDCNGKDDDCNGVVDDGARTDACGPGVCSAVRKKCVNGAQPACDYADPAQNPPGYDPVKDVCGDGLDNNCNGFVDEGCPCSAGQTQPCYLGGCAAGTCKGECRAGTQTCAAPDGGSGGQGTWGPCVGARGPQPESCNGKDDDCDGIVDDNLTDVGGPCSAAAPGLCAQGTWDCPAGASARSCRPGLPRNENCLDSVGDWNCDGKAGCADPVCAGAPCDDRSVCTTGDLCTSGVCTGTTISCDDGNPCTADGCDAISGCTHPVATAGTVCRPAATVCDTAEVCDGTTTNCPPDKFKAASTVCRAAAGPCDAVERCTGSSAACPADKFASGTLCHSPTSGCDSPVTCPGTGPACPAGGPRPSGFVCRAAVDSCDVAETCNGSSLGCPADAWVGAGALCRASTGPCDLADYCSGGSPYCADQYQPDGTACGVGGGAQCLGGGCLETGCNDGVDNDGDGLTDCQDPDCQHKQCGAYPVDSCCGTVCVNTAGDAANCGGCGVVCPSGVCNAWTSGGPPIGGYCACPSGVCPLGQSCNAVNLACTCDNMNSSLCASGATCFDNGTLDFCRY